MLWLKRLFAQVSAALFDPLLPPKPADAVFACPICNRDRKAMDAEPPPARHFRLLLYRRGHCRIAHFTACTAPLMEKMIIAQQQAGEFPPIVASYAIERIHAMVATGERTSSVFCFEEPAEISKFCA